MDEPDRASTELDRADCLDLLAGSSIGRLVFTYRAMPEVVVVNFVLQDESVVVRVSRSSHAAQGATDTVVAFQADRIDEATRTGWSVLVVGHSRPVVSISPPGRAEVVPWVAGEHDAWIAIPLDRVSGRRLAAAAGV